MRNEVKAAGLIKDESQAYYIAAAGIYAGLEKFFQDKTGNHPKEEEEDQIWRVGADIAAQPFGNGNYKLRIENESGRVNLNYADRELLKMLFSSLGVEEAETETIVDSILDWRDTDSLYRLYGAENDYYQSLPKPYKCRDGFFRYVDEILLVRGITRELYDKGLKDVISVVMISNVKIRGRNPMNKGLLNINAVPEALLKILPGMTPEALEGIVDFRREKDISSLQDLIRVIGPEPAMGLQKFIDYHPNRFYTFEAEGRTRHDETRQTIRVMVQEMPLTEKRFRIVQWIDSVSEY
jgi:general secretion pathway protein K